MNEVALQQLCSWSSMNALPLFLLLLLLLLLLLS